MAKILVIDDEPSIVNLVTAYLKPEGYEVLTAMDGPSGLKAARAFKPDLIILPESALLCYLDHRSYLKEQVFSWVDSLKVPIILGSLDWQRAPKGSLYDYLVYNTAFNVDPGSHDMKRYYKIKLVPFSETLPFEGKIPVLSRVNLGEADFQRGKENTVFSIGKKIFAAPLICYEIIYPDFVRQRVKSGANLIVNITNDGWFGKSSGPFQHAMMSRMRSIENGVTLARCANSGFSMFVDPYGRILGQTGLFTREILSKNIPIQKVPSFYNQHGDWLVKLSLLILFVGIVVSVSRRLRKPFPPSGIVK